MFFYKEIIQTNMGLNFCSGRKDVIKSYQYTANQQFSTNYTFANTIGRGSYSQVKLAYQNSTHNKVAVKIIQKAQVLKNSLYPDVQRQKQILQRFQQQNKDNFPFIIKLLECSQDFQHLYFILEYAPKGNLRQLLKNKKTLSMQKIKFISVCMLLTLQRLHNKGIIHGDLKPQNILIDEEGYLKLADFSSAQYYDCSNKLIKGTKGYIAPQIKNRRKFNLPDNQSDLYSLGTILWQMAYGRKYQDYLKKRQSQTKQNQLTGQSSDDSLDTQVTDPAFQEFVTSLLKENPQERLNIKNIWKHPWLNLPKEQKNLYLAKKVTAHPFHPLQSFFEYCRVSLCYRQEQNKRNIYEQSDSLLSSVLLSQKRYQNLFASFSTSSSQRKRTYKLQSENSSEFKLI